MQLYQTSIYQIVVISKRLLGNFLNPQLAVAELAPNNITKQDRYINQQTNKQASNEANQIVEECTVITADGLLVSCGQTAIFAQGRYRFQYKRLTLGAYIVIDNAPARKKRYNHARLARCISDYYRSYEHTIR